MIASVYLGLNLAYSFWLKHIPLLDVLILAVFYVLRVAAGVTLVNVERFSPWLYLVTIFLALFIGVGKRRAEMTFNCRRVEISPACPGFGYTIPLLDQLTIIVSTAPLSRTAYTLFLRPTSRQMTS